MTNPATSSQFIRLFDKNIREVAENKFKSLPTMKDKLYRVINGTSNREEFYSVGAVPDVSEFNGLMTTLGIAPGFHTKIEPKEYGSKLQFERKLLDDKQFDVMNMRAEDLMASAHRVIEKKAVRPFANAFSSAFDYMESEEGVALCSSSHTTKSGTSTTSGFSNAGTSAMSKTSVAATRILMRKFKNDISERIDIGDDLALIYPDQLGDTAFEICKTPKGLDTAEGNVNPQYGRYEQIPYMRLDDSSTTNWFMVWKSQMKKDLVFIDRVSPEIKTNVDFNTLVAEISVYFRIGNGFLDWRWIYGHSV